jgi:hypothetical protein
MGAKGEWVEEESGRRILNLNLISAEELTADEH